LIPAKSPGYAASGVEHFFKTIVDYGGTWVWGTPAKLPWIVVLLLGTGFYVTVRLGLVQVRALGHAFKVVAGKYDDPNDPGDVSHFQALSTALSATVGIGNIAGVAIAIHMGGPGAVFWMWVTAFFGMALKFSECTLAVYYRDYDDKGDVAGGPMYYIEKGLGRSWKPLAMAFAFFAIISSFGGGNMNQANTVAVSAHHEFGLSAYIVGIVLAVVVGVVIVGGIRSIAKVASILAPTMAVIYVSAALLIIAFHLGEVPGAFHDIFAGAFNLDAGLGGAAGSVFMTMLWGVKRGLFSNEAGQGSAPIAHAAAKTDEPVREGVVGLMEPFVDTLVICTMTALVVVMSGAWHEKKPTELPLSGVAVMAAKGAPEPSAEIPVVKGVQTPAAGQVPVTFKVNDGAVDDVVLRAGDTPIDGTLRYDAAGKKVEVVDGSGKTVDATMAGKVLQTSSALTSTAFRRGLSPLGDWGSMVVTICVFLFAVSTMISWSYYGDRCVTYLFGARYVIVYRVIYIGFVYVGATQSLKVVWDYGDLALGLMTVPNLIAVLLLSPKLLELSRDYFRRMREPVPRATARD